MTSNTNLTTKNNIISKNGAPRYANLRSDQTPLPNLNIVTNLYEIIYLCSFSDDGMSKSCTIYCSICSYMDIVFYYNVTYLWQFHMFAIYSFIPKSVTAYYTSRIYYDKITNFTHIHDRYIIVYRSTISNGDITANIRTCSYCRIITYNSICIYDRICTYRHIPPYLCCFVYYRTLMNRYRNIFCVLLLYVCTQLRQC